MDNITEENVRIDENLLQNNEINPLDYAIIKFGKFVNRLCRITSIGANNRYNLQILDDLGVPSRRYDGAIESTALIRQKLDSLGPDLNVARENIVKKRVELNLPDHIPRIEPNKRYKNSSSVSTHVGSPMNKCKIKVKTPKRTGESSTAVDQEGSDGDEGDEARNNLYWAEASPPSESSPVAGKTTVSYGYFCFWYGGVEVNPTDAVSVLPITPIVHLQRNNIENKMDVEISSSIDGNSDVVGGSEVNLIGEFHTDPSSTGFSSTFTSSSTSNGSSSDIAHMNNTPILANSTRNTLTSNKALNTRSTGVYIESTSRSSSTPSPAVLSPVDPILTAHFANFIDVSIESLVPVLRSDLQPIDEQVINRKYILNHDDMNKSNSNVYNVYRSLMIALVQFAEWDCPHRESYLWPDFILPIMKSTSARDTFCQSAVEHRLNTGIRPLSDIMLFLLCAQHVGILEEWNEQAFCSSTATSTATGLQCSDNIAAVLNNLDDFRKSKEEIFRSFCRVGEAFQVTATSLPNCRTISLPLPQQQIDDSKHSLAFSYKEIKKSTNSMSIDSYLGEVHLLREQTLVPGQLIEAPLDLQPFMNYWTLYSKEMKIDSVLTGEMPTAKHRYRLRKLLDTFIATSRRRNRRLTSLCRVQELVAMPLLPPPVLPSKTSTATDKSVSSESEIKMIRSATAGEISGKLSVHSLPAPPISCPMQCDRPPPVTSADIIPSANAGATITTAATATSTVNTIAANTITATSTTNTNADIATTAASTSNTSTDITIDTGLVPPKTSSIPIKPETTVPKKQASPLTSASTRSVIVTYNGDQTVRVPVHFCRIFTVPDDFALEVLQQHQGDAKAALKHISTMLTSSNSIIDIQNHTEDVHSRMKSTTVPNTHTSSPPPSTTTARKLKLDIPVNRMILSYQDLRTFHALVNRPKVNLEHAWNKFNRYLVRNQGQKQQGSNNTSTGTSDNATIATTTNNNTDNNNCKNMNILVKSLPESDEKLSMQSILRLYFLFYPYLDEIQQEEEVPVMSTFNSPLFGSYSPIPLGIATASTTTNSSAAPYKYKPENGFNKPVLPPTGRDTTTTKEKKNVSLNTALKHLPNRWPTSLPMVHHNIYWMPANQSPCICTGLEIKPKSADVKVRIINISTEARNMLISASQMTPFHEEYSRSCSDDRCASFTLALIDFYHWEINNFVPVISSLRIWYIYPQFILSMLLLNSRWIGWRKTVERNSKYPQQQQQQGNSSRREIYRTALIDEYMKLSEDDRNQRYNTDSSYTWDDTPVICPEEDVNLSQSNANSNSSDSEDDMEVAGNISGYESFSEPENPEYDIRLSVHPINIIPAVVSAKSKKNKSKKASNNNSSSSMLFQDHSIGVNSNSNTSTNGSSNTSNGNSSSKKRMRTEQEEENNLKNKKLLKSKSNQNTTSTSTINTEETSNKTNPNTSKYKHSTDNSNIGIKSLYNMFWIPRSKLPCLYYDEPEQRYEDKFRVIPICCVTYHYPFTVNTTNRTGSGIECLKLDHLKLITDERTSEFTYALLDFAQQETARRRHAKAKQQQLQQTQAVGGYKHSTTGTTTETGNGNNENKQLLQTQNSLFEDENNELFWNEPNNTYFQETDTIKKKQQEQKTSTKEQLFDWPECIRHLVNTPSLWNAWRKTAERAGTGPKRYLYLKALNNDYKKYQLEGKEKELQEKERIEHEKLIASRALTNNSIPTTISTHSSCSGSSKSNSKGNSSSSKNSNTSSSNHSNNNTTPKIPQIHSYYNLFWLLRSNLPAIYYDNPDNRNNERFMILPINCCQYQYPIEITNSNVIIEALNEKNITQCSEDRTHDFTLALIDFAKWETAHRKVIEESQTNDLYFNDATISNKNNHTTTKTTSSSNTTINNNSSLNNKQNEEEEQTEENELYNWPTFILRMLNAPDVWAGWRKKAERNATAGSRESKRIIYFRTLKEDYQNQLLNIN